MDEIRELSERLRVIEKRHRHTQLLLIVVAIAASAILLMGQTVVPPQPIITPRGRPESQNPGPIATEGKIRAEGFVLVDAKGNERASLVTDGGGSVFLVLFDKDGKPRADMQVNNYGPSINFYDPNARTRMAIGATTLVASHLAVDGVVEKNTPSSIVLFDAKGGLAWRNP